MNGYTLPENQSKKYEHLFTDIDTGRLKIPKFQREFVWTKEQASQLVDSMLKGYPIGTFVLWKTHEELRHFKEIGNAALPEVPKGDAVTYVLDGQQRITSLFALKKGLVLSREGSSLDYKGILVDLSVDPETPQPLTATERQDGHTYVSVHDLLNQGIQFFVHNFSEEEVERIDLYRNRLTGYDFSTILLSNYPIDIACDIFTRINTAGTELTLFEIMVAKTYDDTRGFDLALKWSTLLEGTEGGGKCLGDASYDTVSSSTVLQCMAAFLKGDVRRETILKLEKTKFIDSWETVSQGLFGAVDYLRTKVGIPVSGLLPYNAMLVPLTYFFIKNGGKKPSHDQDTSLSQYFWWAGLTSRYASATETKIGLDLKRTDKVLGDETPSYKGDEARFAMEDLSLRWFSTSDGVCRSVLCLFAHLEPRSFDNDAKVNLDNSWLKATFSKNYHHFFPRSYLKKRGYPDERANVIMNITIVDDYLNKRTIRARAPSEYMKDFAKKNAKIEESMKSHLIDDLNDFGVWTDDYDRFVDRRAQRVMDELTRRLNPEGARPALRLQAEERGPIR